MRFKNHIYQFVPMLFAGLLIFSSLHTQATTNSGPINIEYNGSLRLVFKSQKDQTPISNLGVNIYKIADVAEDGAITLNYPFNETDLYDKTFINSAQDAGGDPEDESDNGIYTSENEYVAGYFNKTVASENIAPDALKTTSDSGEVVFGFLKPAVYLITVPDKFDKNGEFKVTPFYVCLPYLTKSDNWSYDITAYPKLIGILHVFPGAEKVIKLWDDGDGLNRPKSITVHLFCNGTEYDSVVLPHEGAWEYTWYINSAKSTDIWEVTEDVPPNYLSPVYTNELDSSSYPLQRNFFILNKNKDVTPVIPVTPIDDDTPINPPSPPDIVDEIKENIIRWVQTEDISSISQITAVMAGSGLVILVLGWKRKLSFDKGEIFNGKK